MVHWKTFAPIDKPFTVEPGDAGETIVPVPEINVHTPAPTAGVFPAKVADEEQIVWSGPASAIVGFGSTVIVTWSEEDGHVPLEMVH